jgi:hypothetical protein
MIVSFAVLLGLAAAVVGVVELGCGLPPPPHAEATSAVTAIIAASPPVRSVRTLAPFIHRTSVGTRP